MNAVAEKEPHIEEPQMRDLKKGERLRCLKCGLELEVVAACSCGTGHHARLECCGQPLADA